jgi:hypothetical protein
LGTFLDGIVKCLEAVTPAKAGVHNSLKLLDPRLRGNDEKNTSATYYELIFSSAKKKSNGSGKNFQNSRITLLSKDSQSTTQEKNIATPPLRTGTLLRPLRILRPLSPVQLGL